MPVLLYAKANSGFNYEEVVEANSSWLADLHYKSHIQQSNTLQAIMLMFSVVQYDPNIMASNPAAISVATKAAFVQSGAQQWQNKLENYAEQKTKKAINYMGITDKELGAAYIAYKIVQDKEIKAKGPDIYFINTSLTVGLDHGTIGLSWRFE